MSQFMAITDQSADVARGCLEMTEGDVMAAVNMFFENPEIANSFNNPSAAAAAATSSTAASAAGASSRPQASSRSSRPIGREDEAGVIHIDDDDDDDDGFDDALDDFNDDDEEQSTNPAHLQRIAQESDDAAMARRLQEEMYGGGGSAAGGGVDPDGVRAPIARTTETLVAPSGYGGYGIGDDDDDVGAAMREMARRRARPASRSQPLVLFKLTHPIVAKV